MLRGAILALACLAACSPPPAEPPAAAPPAAPEAVLSADGYGPIRIGMTAEEASAAYGHAFVADPALDAPEICQTYRPADGAPQDGLRLLTRNNRIASVTDHGSAAVRTAEGIGVGSTLAQVQAAYPSAVRREAAYDEPPAHELIAWRTPETSGMLFVISGQGVVTTIRAGDDSILLIEGCA